MRATSDQEHWDNIRKRPSFDEIYMRLAYDLSKRSACRRLAVGCVIVSDDYLYPLGLGYNGNVHGFANDCDVVGEQAVGACGCIHAESNAIIKCRAEKAQKKIVYTTIQPCVACAKMLIQLGGVTKVVYDKPYRIPWAVELLAAAQIETLQFSP